MLNNITNNIDAILSFKKQGAFQNMHKDMNEHIGECIRTTWLKSFYVTIHFYDGKSIRIIIVKKIL